MTVSFAKTQGLPAYSSVRAGLDLEIDIPEAACNECPEVIVAEIRRAYQLAETEVAGQLARHQVDPEPPAAPSRDRLPSQARPPSEPEPDRQPRRPEPETERRGPSAGWPADSFPKSGRQLIAWSRKREESGENPGLFKRLVAYGRAVGYADRMTEWSGSEVSEAVHAVLGGPDQYDDEPAPAGRNGYHNGNGHGGGYR